MQSTAGQGTRRRPGRGAIDPVFQALTSIAGRPVGLLALVIACDVVGLLGALVAARQGGLAALATPTWAPPPQLLPAVAVVLHTMMGIAAWLVIRRTEQRPEQRRHALAAFAGQLVFHAMWLPVLHVPAAALLVAAVLAPSVAWTMTWFWAESRIAGLLLVPALGWVGFVTVFAAMSFAR
jgi:tryptophan-rich sensory protein